MKQYKWVRKVIVVMMCAVLVFAAAACSNSSSPDTNAPATAAPGGASPGTSSTARDTLNMIIPEDIANLDPNISNVIAHCQVTRNIYETLFVYDKNYELQPWLCESYKYVDDNTVNLKIRQGVLFQNGDELKASDVLFTFQRIFDQKLVSTVELASLDIAKCSVLDDYTIQLVTTSPAPTQIAKLEMSDTAILSERAYTEANGDFMKGACVGTGPYKLVSYAPGDRVVLEGFDDYWRKAQGEPHIKNVNIRFVSDAASRAMEAETGGADIVYNIGRQDVASIDSADGISIFDVLGTFTLHLVFNTAKAPLDDVRVREAIWKGVDIKAAVAAVYGDFGEAAQGWVTPGVLGFDETQAATYFPQRDVAAAKALLAEAGYANGLSLTISAAADNMGRPELAEAFQAQLAEVGITISLDIADMNANWASVTNGEHELAITGYTAADFEADRPLSYFRPSASGYKIVSFGDQAFQDAITQSMQEMDRDTRAKLYIQAQKMLLENYITLPIWHKAVNAAISDDLQGFDISRSFEQLYLQYVSFK